MATQELTVKISESVAREAEAIGLLKPDALERLLREEIRRRRAAGLFADADRLAALNQPPLTDDEISAEIQAARAERRNGRASGG